jgi:hypothetical protein
MKTFTGKRDKVHKE